MALRDDPKKENYYTRKKDAREQDDFGGDEKMVEHGLKARLM